MTRPDEKGEGGPGKDGERPDAVRKLIPTEYGPIPVVWMARTDGTGYWGVDPDWVSTLPAGVVVGDVSKQIYCAVCHAPKYYYVDERCTCVQCGAEFVFSATEQKYWYETLHFHFDSKAIRCVKCRREKRFERGAQIRLAEAGQLRKEKPEDPDALLEFAEAIMELRRVSGEGDLAAAIAACRKARQVSPEAILAWYWEGVAQELAGRTARACECYGEFVDRAGEDERYARFVKEARGRTGR